MEETRCPVWEGTGEADPGTEEPCMQAPQGASQRGACHCISTQGSTLSQGSSPEMGMAASRMSELPVPGGVCMKAEWLKSGHCRRNANIRGDMGAFQS